jgi:hypothetical protein
MLKAQRDAVIRGLRETTIGQNVPVILRPPETQRPESEDPDSQPYNFPEGTQTYILAEYLVEGVIARWPRSQLRKIRNLDTFEFDIYDGQIERATLAITIGSKDESAIRDQAESLKHDIQENLLGLYKDRDKVWVGKDEVLAFRDLKGAMDLVLRHYVHRYLIELQLEYEVSWKRIGPAIKTIAVKMQLPGQKIRGTNLFKPVAEDNYVMKPIFIPLPAYMALGINYDLDLAAHMARSKSSIMTLMASIYID